MKKLCNCFIVFIKKLLNCLRKYTSLIAILVALISVVTARYSQYNANRVFEYTKKINKASISILDTNTNIKYSSVDSIQINFLFYLSNTGNEPLSILNSSTAIFNFKDNSFQYIYPDDSTINILHPGAKFFSYINIPTINLDGTDISPKYLSHPLSIMMKIKYKTPFVTDSIILYMITNDFLELSYLSRVDYNLMKSFLPVEFRFDP